MVLAVPPLDESAIFTQIPLSEDLIPLDDLGASGGYGRQLILPDDVPPVLALPWALGPRLPRVNRCQDDGALNVHVENASGGVGSPAPFRSFGINGLTTAGENLLQNMPSTTATLYSLTLTVYTDPSQPVAAAGYSALVLEVWNHASTSGMPLLSGGISWDKNAAGNYTPAVAALSIVWPSPLDVATAVGISSGLPQLKLNATAAGLRYSYCAVAVLP